MTTDPTPADILRDAAQYLQLHGWHQGALYAGHGDINADANPTPAACALGAITLVVFGHRIPEDLDETVGDITYRQTSNILDDYLTLTGAKNTVPVHNDDYINSVSVGDWNDAPGRTAAEVIAALHAAADHYDHTPAATPAGPCWSGFCIASFCDGIQHGHTWTETQPAVDQ